MATNPLDNPLGKAAKSVLSKLGREATVYRSSEARDANGDPVPTWTSQTGVVYIAISIPGSQATTLRLRDYGPGEQSGVGYVDGIAWSSAVTINPRDVVKITSGPDINTTWRVEAVQRVATDTTQLTLSTYTGTL